MGIQKYSLDKEGLGYSYSNCEKYYKKFFVNASTSSKHFVTCNYCGNNGHISSSCYMRKNGFNKSKYVWILKGQGKPKFNVTNHEGSKKIWVPKKSQHCVVGMS